MRHAAMPLQPLQIALVGDSTVCAYPAGSAQRGWGELLPDFLGPGFRVINEAECGLSTRTFPRDRWGRILSSGVDLVLIQFGHNDSHEPGRPESTDALTEYPDNLRCFCREALDALVAPILVTPPHRRRFEEGVLTSELSPYADSMRRVGEEMDVPVIDLHGLTGELLQYLGEPESESLTMNRDGMDPDVDDRSHFTIHGARLLARLVAHSLVHTLPAMADQVRASAAEMSCR